MFLLRSLHHNSLTTAFDPKPFIQTFEAAIDKLIAVRKDVQTRTEQMEKSVRVSEREYSKKMSDLNRGFEVRVDVTCPLPRTDSMSIDRRELVLGDGESDERSGKHGYTDR